MCNTSVMCNPYVNFSYIYESLMCNPYWEVCMKLQMMKYILHNIFYKLIDIWNIFYKWIDGSSFHLILNKLHYNIYIPTFFKHLIYSLCMYIYDICFMNCWLCYFSRAFSMGLSMDGFQNFFWFEGFNFSTSLVRVLF